MELRVIVTKINAQCVEDRGRAAMAAEFDLGDAVDKSASLIAAVRAALPASSRAVSRKLPPRSDGDGLRLLELFAGIGGMRAGLEAAGVELSSVIAVDTSPLAVVTYAHNFFPASPTRDTEHGGASGESGGTDGELRGGQDAGSAAADSRTDSACTSRAGVAASEPSSAVAGDPDGAAGGAGGATARSCDDRVWQVNVESLSAAQLDAIAADIWTLSPPCQPFTTTKNAKRRDVVDLRCKALTHLTAALPALLHPPRAIFLENVKGFEGSEALAAWKGALREAGYTFRCFLYDPADLGVPNHRMRFYMLAVLGDGFAGFDGEEIERSRDAAAPEAGRAAHSDAPDKSRRPMSDFLLEHTEEELSALLLSSKQLSKPYAKGLSVVGPHDRLTFCFTSAYGKSFHKSAGSVLLADAAAPISSAEGAAEIDRDNMVALAGRLRLLSPEELLLIFGFPRRFSFPPILTTRNRWKLVGQSVNVVAVTALAKILVDSGALSGSKRIDSSA